MKRGVTTNFAEEGEVTEELLRSDDFSVNPVPSSKVPVTIEASATELAAVLNNDISRIAELGTIQNITVRRHKGLLDDAKQHHAELVSVWKEPSAEDANTSINDVEVAKADTVQRFVERNFILARFEKHGRFLQTLFKANVEWKVTVLETSAKIRELLKSGRLIT